MNESYAAREDDLGGVLYARIFFLIRKNRRAWQSIGATFGIAGGMLSIMLGALLGIIVRFLATGPTGSFLNVIEIIFFVLTMPLLALGAYCLDLLEKKAIGPLLPGKFMPDDIEQCYRLRPQRPNNN